MNLKIIVDEFKSTSKNLLKYNQQKLIQLLQKFDLLTINYNQYQNPTGPVAPVYSNRFGPTGDIWPISTCPTGPTFYQSPTGPTGPLSYQTLDMFLNGAECYFDMENSELFTRLKMYNYECNVTTLKEIASIQNLDNANNYNSSMYKSLKRKIHEYDVLIEKLKSQLVDYKKSAASEMSKPLTTLREINNTINEQVNQRLKNLDVVTPETKQMIIDQVNKEVTASFSTTATQTKYEVYTAGWLAVTDKINYLTKEKEKIKKLISSEDPVPLTKLIKQDNIPSLKDQNSYRIDELKTILENLKKANASQDQIQSVIDKIDELKNKY